MHTNCFPLASSASFAKDKSEPGRKLPCKLQYPKTSELSVQSGRTGINSLSAPVALAIRLGSLDLPVPDTPAKITNGFVSKHKHKLLFARVQMYSPGKGWFE